MYKSELNADRGRAAKNPKILQTSLMEAPRGRVNLCARHLSPVSVNGGGQREFNMCLQSDRSPETLRHLGRRKLRSDPNKFLSTFPKRFHYNHYAQLRGLGKSHMECNRVTYIITEMCKIISNRLSETAPAGRRTL